ncbi:MAG: cell division protein FtsQ/DivIB [Bacteroidia bacterium]
MKKIINISLWSLFALGTLVTLGFVQKEQGKRRATGLDININAEEESYFVTRDDIRQMLTDKGDSIIHQPLSTIHVAELERLIDNNPCVSKSEVFVSVNGQVRIKASQRKPVARVFSMSGDSYYMDADGKLMPWSVNYTADVVAVNGFITESYGNWYRYSARDIESMPTLRAYSVLDDIYKIADFIQKDPFRKSLIGQIYVNADKEFELIPTAGTFRILLGDSGDLEEKFSKLKTFYREGLRNTGDWDAYSSVSLKYKNQIVCTKRIASWNQTL